MTSSLMQEVVRKLQDDYARLDAFLTKQQNQHHSEPHHTRAVLKTPCVAIVTENHGVFVIDTQDIYRLMESKRDTLGRELAQFTALGDKIAT